jgi:carboxymethylenebutenolidase
MQDPSFAAGAVARLTTIVDALEREPGVDGRIAVVGFCFGGTYAFALAAADPRVRAAVPFYGTAPSAAEIARIRCPVLAFYGRRDERLMTALRGVESAFADAGVALTTQVYPDAGHAFFNDTNPHAYDPSAAEDAWERATSFLAAQLEGHALAG